MIFLSAPFLLGYVVNFISIVLKILFGDWIVGLAIIACFVFVVVI